MSKLKKKKQRLMVMHGSKSSFLYECIQSVELLFNRLILPKSSEINRLYVQINLLNSLITKLY